MLECFPVNVFKLISKVIVNYRIQILLICVDDTDYKKDIVAISSSSTSTSIQVVLIVYLFLSFLFYVLYLCIPCEKFIFFGNRFYQQHFYFLSCFRIVMHGNLLQIQTKLHLYHYFHLINMKVKVR